MTSQLQRSRKLASSQQNGRCYYCTVQMRPPDARGGGGLACTAEHLLPRSEGGGDDSNNIVAACSHCNRTRHRRKHPPPHGHYQQEVQRRVRAGGWHPQWVFQRGLIAAVSGGPEVRRLANNTEDG
jgi:5-methylcytosine-specific restriction endonuclease McrA